MKSFQRFIVQDIKTYQKLSSWEQKNKHNKFNDLFSVKSSIISKIMTIDSAKQTNSFLSFFIRFLHKDYRSDRFVF